MKRKYFMTAICVLIITGFLSGMAFSDNTVTITGKVNESYQVVTDTEVIYEIGSNDKGDELVDMVDKKVKVTGTVMEDEGTKVIMVISYKVIDEDE
jgi:hypothetical protein